ncbi:MAG: hypothetical protein ABW321_02920, partial [Polyangiales bacterium]
MRRLVVLGVSAAFFLGCAAPQPATPHAPTLEDLQRTAAERPRDPDAWRALTLAELLGPGGDAVRAQNALIRARTLAPTQPELLAAQGLLADMHGHPSDALDAYLSTIEHGVAAGDAEGSMLAEIASYAVLGQNGLSRGFADRVRPRLTALLKSSKLSLAARAALSDVLVRLAYRRGDVAEVASLSEQLGCITSARVAGPFGPRELLGFDAPPPIDLAQPLPAASDLGPGRGTRPARTLRAQGCRLNLGGGEVADGGMSLAEATLNVPTAGDYTLRLDTPNSAELFIDGHSALRVDRRKQLGARVTFAKLSLTAGAHRVLVRLSSRHPNPVLELALAPYRATDASDVDATVARVYSPELGTYLRVALALARGDVVTAREALTSAVQHKQVSPLLLLQRAGIALSDPLTPDTVRADEARRYLSLATRRDPAAWAPIVQLASLAAKAGQVKESIAVLRKAEQRWPEVPAIGLALAELLRSKSFNAAADRALARVRENVPDACAPLAAQLDSLRARQRYAEVIPLAQELVRCDAQSNVLYGLYLEQRDFERAAAELARLDALQPETGRYASLLARLALARNRDDDAAADGLLQELRARYPRSYAGAIDQIDGLAARGDTRAALAQLAKAVEAEPAAMAALYRVRSALGQPHVLEAYRKDGLAAIRAFQASGKTYAGPQVLVLDYMAMQLFEDGSSLELIHTVQRAQSSEAVDQLAEVEIPDGAQVLTLRAIKPDGRKLEADNIAGKNTVSLPNVAPGDYIELELLQAKSPAEGFPN